MERREEGPMGYEEEMEQTPESTPAGDTALDARISPLEPGLNRSAGVRIDVHGELDVATGPILVQRVQRLLADVPITRVQLDLARLRFVDVAGIRSLQHIAVVAAAGRAELVLVRPPECLRSVLELVVHRRWLGLHLAASPWGAVASSPTVRRPASQCAGSLRPRERRPLRPVGAQRASSTNSVPEASR
jgi:anti-anti-sigma factor